MAKKTKGGKKGGGCGKQRIALPPWPRQMALKSAPPYGGLRPMVKTYVCGTQNTSSTLVDHPSLFKQNYYF